eukprot:TRINITY_DN4678_c0_g1_i3.p1 TRINITY_DN4678_c0_g1~~TRINITY_DN4678_c0_g1_i3.p1  ORF type:complete len:994 (-),score=449.28 TRINITY_DN4678_c0_g1_i3:206-3187(-)
MEKSTKEENLYQFLKRRLTSSPSSYSNLLSKPSSHPFTLSNPKPVQISPSKQSNGKEEEKSKEQNGKVEEEKVEEKVEENEKEKENPLNELESNKMEVKEHKEEEKKETENGEKEENETEKEKEKEDQKVEEKKEEEMKHNETPNEDSKEKEKESGKVEEKVEEKQKEGEKSLENTNIESNGKSEEIEFNESEEFKSFDERRKEREEPMIFTSVFKNEFIVCIEEWKDFELDIFASPTEIDVIFNQLNGKEEKKKEFKHKVKTPQKIKLEAKKNWLLLKDLSYRIFTYRFEEASNSVKRKKSTPIIDSSEHLSLSTLLSAASAMASPRSDYPNSPPSHPFDAFNPVNSVSFSDDDDKDDQEYEGDDKKKGKKKQKTQEKKKETKVGTNPANKAKNVLINPLSLPLKQTSSVNPQANHTLSTPAVAVKLTTYSKAPSNTSTATSKPLNNNSSLPSNARPYPIYNNSANSTTNASSVSNSNNNTTAPPKQIINLSPKPVFSPITKPLTTTVPPRLVPPQTSPPKNNIALKINTTSSTVKTPATKAQLSPNSSAPTSISLNNQPKAVAVVDLSKNAGSNTTAPLTTSTLPVSNASNSSNNNNPLPTFITVKLQNKPSDTTNLTNETEAAKNVSTVTPSTPSSSSTTATSSNAVDNTSQKHLPSSQEKRNRNGLMELANLLASPQSLILNSRPKRKEIHSSSEEEEEDEKRREKQREKRKKNEKEPDSSVSEDFYNSLHQIVRNRKQNPNAEMDLNGLKPYFNSILQFSSFPPSFSEEAKKEDPEEQDPAAKKCKGISAEQFGINDLHGVRLETILHLAARSDLTQVVKAICLHPLIDPFILDKRGRTPLELAKKNRAAGEITALLRRVELDLKPPKKKAPNSNNEVAATTKESNTAKKPQKTVKKKTSVSNKGSESDEEDGEGEEHEESSDEDEEAKKKDEAVKKAKILIQKWLDKQEKPFECKLAGKEKEKIQQQTGLTAANISKVLYNLKKKLN